MHIVKCAVHLNRPAYFARLRPSDGTRVTHLRLSRSLQASEGRADTLELAQRVNEYQAKLRTVTRRIMATVSELSMYQVGDGEMWDTDHGLLVGCCPTQ